MILLTILLTACAAILGGYAGLKLRIPAGALIGSMLLTAALNVAFSAAYMPADVKFYTQVATGIYIGAKISRSNLQDLKRILKPALLLLLIMLIFSVCVGLVIYSVSDLSISTALFAMAPGGITDMTLASMDFSAESSVVALIQTLRVIFTTALLPFLIKWVHSRRKSTITAQKDASSTPKSKRSSGPLDLGLTLLIGLFSGAVGKYLDFPCGAIAFSMVGCATFNVVTDRGYMPLNLRRFVQMFAGALIGCTVGRSQILQMLELWNVTILAIASFLLLDLLSAAAISRVFRIDAVTALFACAPGGVSDMALIAEDMGADSVTVAGMHVVRLIGIVALYPIIIQILLLFLT